MLPPTVLPPGVGADEPGVNSIPIASAGAVCQVSCPVQKSHFPVTQAYTRSIVENGSTNPGGVEHVAAGSPHSAAPPNSDEPTLESPGAVSPPPTATLAELSCEVEPATAPGDPATSAFPPGGSETSAFPAHAANAIENKLAVRCRIGMRPSLKTRGLLCMVE